MSFLCYMCLNRGIINRQKRELKMLGCTKEENMYWEYESNITKYMPN